MILAFLIFKKYSQINKKELANPLRYYILDTSPTIKKIDKILYNNPELKRQLEAELEDELNANNPNP